MKQVLIIIIAMGLGAGSYALFLSQFGNQGQTDEDEAALEARLEAQRKVDEARAQNQLPPEEEAAISDVTETPPPTTVDTFGARTTGPFKIIGTSQHPASGSIELIDSPEEKLVYFKNYQGSDGVGLRIYLAKDLTPEGALDLGGAKGSSGDLVYGVPLNVNFSDYRYVITWSESANTLFDYAEID